MCLCLGTRRGCDGFQCMEPEEPGETSRQEEAAYYAAMWETSQAAKEFAHQREQAESAASVIWSFT